MITPHQARLSGIHRTYNPGQKCWNTIFKALIYPSPLPSPMLRKLSFYAELNHYHTHCNIDFGGGGEKPDMREDTVKNVKAFQILSPIQNIFLSVPTTFVQDCRSLLVVRQASYSIAGAYTLLKKCSKRSLRTQ